jgi:hypothetical protein
MSEANGSHTALNVAILPSVELARMRRVAAQVGMTFEDYIQALAKIAGKTPEDFLKQHAEEAAASPGRPSAIEIAINPFAARTEEQILADRERILRTSRKPRPLPEGKTLDDVLAELQLDDDPEEEVLEWLEKLS